MESKPITKKEIEELKPSPFQEVLTYPRYSNGLIVPNGEPVFNGKEWVESKPRTKMEFWPNEGIYKPKMRRK